MFGSPGLYVTCLLTAKEREGRVCDNQLRKQTSY